MLMPAVPVERMGAYRVISPLLVAALLLTYCAPCLPTTASAGGLSAQERLDSVSAARMLEIVQDLEGLGSRAFCLEGAQAAAEYIHSKLAELGMDVRFQNFTFANYACTNVVAVANGTDPDAGIVLFGAHYDSENRMATNLSLARELPAPGADDDASGVAAVIELARALSGVQVRQTLKFVAFGAEEMGFDNSGGVRGSSYFVGQEVKAGSEYECAVLLDMIGYSGGLDSQGVIVTRNTEVDFADAAVAAGTKWGLDIELKVLREPMITYSDHAPFWLAGFQAVLVMERLSIEGHPANPYYHSSLDTAEALSEAQMENITRSVLAGALAILDPAGQTPASIIILAVAAAAATAIIMFVYYSRRVRRGEVR